METICGVRCDEGCPFSKDCKGCAETGGRPFGGSCVAAEYIKAGGKEKYEEFKKLLLAEVNGLLAGCGAPEAEKLWELPGWYVDLAYRLPSGREASFLDGSKIYLGAQIEAPGLERCWGVVADMDFILVCSYGEGGSDPELLAYRKR